MKNKLLVMALFFAVSVCFAQEKVVESSTGKSFPSVEKFKYNGTDYSVNLTGVTVRKKFFFKVYGMAHYLQDPVKSDKKTGINNILSDGKAKQISMIFVRDVDKKKIQDTYMEGFQNNSSQEDFNKIQPQVNQFLGYFSKDVNENDEIVLRWLPGGTVITIFQGEEKPAITNKMFARILWSIWFGDDSPVDVDDLISRIVK
jgi:hypothetical protein